MNPNISSGGQVLFCFGKILYQPIAPKIPDSYFGKREIHF
jgi:hypothetical protein